MLNALSNAKEGYAMSSTFFIPAVNIMGIGCLEEAMTAIVGYGFRKALIVTDTGLAKAGVAYCLIPRLQITLELDCGALITLPAPSLYRHLYWHRWVLERGIYKRISDAVIQHCNHHLGHNNKNALE
jgi:hypothetical protein